MSIMELKSSIFFNKKNILRYLSFFIFFIFFFSVIIFTIVGSVYKDIYNLYIKKIETIDRTEGKDISLMCNVIGCESLIYKIDDVKYYYVNKNGILNYTNKIVKDDIYFDIYTEDFKTVIVYDDITFIVDDSRYMNLVMDILYLVLVSFFIFYTLIFTIFTIKNHKFNIMEKGSFKFELESRLQRDITESLHHEMGMPIALIDTLVKDLYMHLYPCDFSSNGICDFNNEEVESTVCETCKNNLNKRSIDGFAVDHYNKIRFAIDRLNSVLSLIAGSKHIKYNNGTVSLYSIIDNIISSVNSFKVNKITAKYVNEELFHKYAVGLGLSNGDMLNMIHNMVNNSIEAKATEIEFKAVIRNEYKLDIYIQDNGRGIRDKNDNIIKDDIIFNYGYSTKDEEYNKLLSLTKVRNIIEKIYRFIFKSSLFSIYNTTRGVGLAVNKGLLIGSGGDIVLIDTSSAGTTFRLTIPMKLKRDK